MGQTSQRGFPGGIFLNFIIVDHMFYPCFTYKILLNQDVNLTSYTKSNLNPATFYHHFYTLWHPRAPP